MYIYVSAAAAMRYTHTYAGHIPRHNAYTLWHEIICLIPPQRIKYCVPHAIVHQCN